MDCPACAAEIAGDSRFCPFCGTQLPASRADTSGATVSAEADVTPRRTALLDCPSCGAPNSSRRAVCGRCGVDLASGDPPSRRLAEEPATVDSDDPGPRVPTWILVVLGGAILGAAVGLGVWFSFGAGNDATTDMPTFDPAVHDEDPRPLDVAGAAASSTLSGEGTIGYEPELAVDGDPATAWNEGAEDGAGIGETLTLELEEESWVSSIVVRNGYQRDDVSFLENARAARMLARFDGGADYVLVLHDRSGRQVVRLPQPVLTRSVEFEIQDVYAGDTYADLAVSEVDVMGWPAR